MGASNQQPLVPAAVRTSSVPLHQNKNLKAGGLEGCRLEGGLKGWRAGGWRAGFRRSTNDTKKARKAGELEGWEAPVLEGWTAEGGLDGLEG